MKIQRWIGCLAVVWGISMLSAPVCEAKKKAFELYSWPQDGTANYCYSILTASKETPPPAEIKASKDQVCGGSGDLKRIMGQAMPLGSKVTWKTDAANGFVLPTRDIVNDLKRFAETIPYKLVVTEPN